MTDYSRTGLHPQTLKGRGALGILRRQQVGPAKALWLFCYYAVAIHLFDTPMPLSGISGAFRVLLARRIFKRCGERVVIGRGAVFGTGHLLELGDDSAINRDCWIANDTVIGNDVMMGPRVTVLSSAHEFSDTSRPMREQGASQRRPVRIGDDVWIGTQSILLPDVHVGSHSIIGAGSVVTRDVEPWSVLAGNPARLIRKRRPEPSDRSEETDRVG